MDNFGQIGKYILQLCTSAECGVKIRGKEAKEERGKGRRKRKEETEEKGKGKKENRKKENRKKERRKERKICGFHTFTRSFKFSFTISSVFLMNSRSTSSYSFL